MAHLNQYLLLLAMMFASCTILLVHVFVFPLYDPKLTKPPIKTVGELEQGLCMTNTGRRLTRTKRHKCPAEGIVTVAQGGRLGNQIWEYASVWGVARVTGLVPYVPRCIRAALDPVFARLSVPPLSRVSHCTVHYWSSGSLDSWNGTSILLPRFVVMPDLVLSWVNDIRHELTFKPKLYENAQSILRSFGQSLMLQKHAHSLELLNTVSHEEFSKKHIKLKTKNKKLHLKLRPGNITRLRLEDFNLTYVGVHVRRTDYRGYLWRTRKMNLADAAYFRRAMDYFREKYGRVAFVIVSDESTWCRENLSAKDVLVVRASSPGLDLALMASCNHSIIDYGTFGVWGAILAGGETVLYNISRHSSVRVAQLLPNWHVMN